jgi:hypothetical protein
MTIVTTAPPRLDAALLLDGVERMQARAPVTHPNGRDSCDYWCGVSSPDGTSSAACCHLARISASNQTRISASVTRRAPPQTG